MCFFAYFDFLFFLNADKTTRGELGLLMASAIPEAQGAASK
jgi:hypothetical protein